jgi:hypothetical protein
MTIRLCQGQRKAEERVALKKQQLHAVQEHFTPDSARGRGAQMSHDMLEEQRRLALLRVAEKRREEDRAIHERLKAEEEERQQLKKKMEEKAEQLREATAQRVAAYKVRSSSEWRLADVRWVGIIGCQERESS